MPNRLVKRRRNGKVYYVNADPSGCGCAYVGSPNAYANYRNSVSAIVTTTIASSPR